MNARHLLDSAGTTTPRPAEPEDEPILRVVYECGGGNMFEDLRLMFLELRRSMLLSTDTQPTTNELPVLPQ